MERTGSTSEIRIPTDEEEARLFLLQEGVLKTWDSCPWCGGQNVGMIRRSKYRCRNCGREWGMRKGSILEGTRISFRTFVNTVQFYADDIPVNDAARRLGTAYNTTYDTYTRIRRAVIEKDKKDSMAATIPPDAQRTIVFGIRIAEGIVSIEPVDNPGPELITTLPVPTMQRGNILFIDAYGKKYQGFITYFPDRRGQELVRIRSADGFPWSPLAEFWAFAGKSWMAHRGIARDRIPVFLTELVQRYNTREADRFLEIVKKIAACRFPSGASPVSGGRETAREHQAATGSH